MSDNKKNNDIRENLLGIGVTLFSEHGFHGTGIKEIVDLAGVPKGSFYNYFDSKEEYAAEIIKHYAGLNSLKWQSYISRGPEDNALQMLYNSFEAVIEYHENSSVKTGCLIGNLSGELAESSDLCRVTLKSAMDGWCKSLAYYLGLAQEQGTVRKDIPAEELAILFWNAWEGCLLRMKIENSTDPVRRCIDLMFNDFFKPQPL